jgi:hypothetical protein
MWSLRDVVAVRQANRYSNAATLELNAENVKRQFIDFRCFI